MYRFSSRKLNEIFLDQKVIYEIKSDETDSIKYIRKLIEISGARQDDRKTIHTQSARLQQPFRFPTRSPQADLQTHARKRIQNSRRVPVKRQRGHLVAIEWEICRQGLWFVRRRSFGTKTELFGGGKWVRSFTVWFLGVFGSVFTFCKCDFLWCVFFLEFFYIDSVIYT